MERDGKPIYYYREGKQFDRSKVGQRMPPKVSAQYRFKPGSPVSIAAEELAEAGLAGVAELNGPEIVRLVSESGFKEVLAVLDVAKRIALETGVVPEVKAGDLVNLARIAGVDGSASLDVGHRKLVRERLEQERAIVRAKIIEAAGGMTVGQSLLSGEPPNPS